MTNFTAGNLPSFQNPVDEATINAMFETYTSATGKVTMPQGNRTCAHEHIDFHSSCSDGSVTVTLNDSTPMPETTLDTTLRSPDHLGLQQSTRWPSHRDLFY